LVIRTLTSRKVCAYPLSVIHCAPKSNDAALLALHEHREW